METAQQADMLRALGVDELQGYYYARPMAADPFAHWLRERRRALGPVASAPTRPADLSIA
jgi:EAL domain-containing protein (putative c-di-GMP-specific phosphodiesterase class I)